MSDDGVDDPRARRAWQIGGYGTAIAGTLLAGIAALSGAGGVGGLAFFLLGGSVACAAGTLYAVVTGALDSFRGHPIGRSRVVAAITLGGLSLVLPIMMLGLGGG